MNIKTDTGFYVGYYSIFDRKPISVNQHPANQEMLRQYEQEKDVKRLIRFTKGYYALEKKSDTLVLYDTRFGQASVDPAAPFFFAFDILNKDSTITVKQAEFRKMKEDDIKILYQRAKGN
jgi:inner membrane protein